MGRIEINTKVRRARRLMGAGLGLPLIGPQVVSLETTHYCNLRCSFCESHGNLLAAPITATREYVGGRRMMSLETIQRLAGELAEAGTDLVELSGKGDPITHPQLTEILRALAGAGLRIAVVTNGTLAAADLAPALVDIGLVRLSVSLNAGCRDAYLRSNHQDLWDRAIAFLDQVLGERKRRASHLPHVRLTHVVSKENVDDVEGMVAICEKLHVDEVNFYVMGELPQTHHLQLDVDQALGIRERIPAWSRRLDAAGVRHDLPGFGHDLDLRVRLGGCAPAQENPLQRLLPCYEGWMFCVIGPDGVVVPCCYCEEEKLGNVVDQSFADIWRGHLYREFRRRSREIPRTGRWICAECFTSCNRALENRRIHNRLHPFSPVALPPSRPAPSGAVRDS